MPICKLIQLYGREHNIIDNSYFECFSFAAAGSSNKQCAADLCNAAEKRDERAIRKWSVCKRKAGAVELVRVWERFIDGAELQMQGSVYNTLIHN